MFRIIVFLFTVVNAHQLQLEEIQQATCDLKHLNQAVSAIQRAKSNDCKLEIADLACQSPVEKSFDKKCSKLITREVITSTDDIYSRKSQSEVENELNSYLKELPRIVFLFTVNGRGIRQILRVLKSIYNVQHFYYFHVDERMHYLRQELKRFEHLKNVHVSSWSMPTIWGGASLLQMQLRAFQDLAAMKGNGLWDWDFVFNLSESDFPIKSVEELTVYLGEHMDRIFLRFRSKNVPLEEWYKKSGILNTFIQCDNHMWRVGERKLPSGLGIDGGSDWFCLNSEFINYVLNSSDDYLIYLKKFYNYTLLPSESFFHSVAINSPFCEKIVNSNLRFVHWQRGRGCQCQYLHLVDWCGCSPNIMTFKNWPLIQKLQAKPYFFVRKVDPMFNSQLINNIDQSVFGLYSSRFKSLNTYWLNIFDQNDFSTETKNQIVFDYIANSSSKFLIERLEHSKDYLDSADQIIDLVSKVNTEKHLVKVNSFFQSEKYKGFVLNFQISDDKTDMMIDYEAFYTPKKMLEIKNSQGSENFFKVLQNIEISSDYDAKEQILSNYARVIDQKTNPQLLLQIDPIEQPLSLQITWSNSEVSNKRKLNEEADLNTTGIWTINICFNDSQPILFQRFLVLPSNNPLRTEAESESLKNWLEMLDQSWQFDSLCINTKLDLDSDSFAVSNLINECTESYWSSFYPDPKSDFNGKPLDPKELRIQ